MLKTIGHNTLRAQKIQYYVSILSSLMACFVIAVFYRIQETNISLVLGYFWPTDFTLFRTTLSAILPPLPDLMVYSIPEGLWVYCLTLIGFNIHLKLFNHQLQLVYVPIFAALALEMMQLFHLTDGTFDFHDIWVSILFWFLAMIMGQFSVFLQLKRTTGKSKMDFIFFFLVFFVVYMADVGHVFSAVF